MDADPPPPVGSLIFLHDHAPLWDPETGREIAGVAGPIILTEVRPSAAVLALGLLRGFSADLARVVDFLQIDVVTP